MRPEPDFIAASEAEKAIAGAALTYPEQTVQLLDDAGFEHEAMVLPAPKHVVAFVRGAVGRKAAVDFVTVATDVQRHFPDLSPAFLTSLTEHIGNGARVASWCGAVREAKVRRDAIAFTGSQLELLKGGANVSEVFEVTKGWLQAQQRAFAPTKSAMLRDLIDAQLEAYSRPEDKSRTIKTGITELDERMTLETSDLLVIGGATGSGKSMLGLNLVTNILKASPDYSGMIISLEMTQAQVTERMLARYSGVATHRLKRRDYTAGELQRIGHAAQELCTLPLVVRDDCHALHQVTSAARALHANKPLRVLMVDYLQLVRGPDVELREQQVAAVSRELRLLAIETGCLVIALAQLNKAGEARESSAIMMDATQFVTVRAVNSEGKAFNPHDEEDEIDETRRRLDIGKQRDGGVGSVLVGFEGAVARFHDTEHSEKGIAKGSKWRQK